MKRRKKQTIELTSSCSPNFCESLIRTPDETGRDFERVLAAVHGRCGDITDADCCRFNRFRTLNKTFQKKTKRSSLIEITPVNSVD